MLRSLILVLMVVLASSLTGRSQSTYYVPPGSSGVPISLPSGSTATTNANPYDYTTSVATDQTVVNLTDIQMALVPIGNITGGVYSFNSACTGNHVLYFASGGAVTGINTWILAGSGCQAGDVITFDAGNYDSLIQITAVNGSGQPTAGTVLYGGTGYPPGLSASTAQTGNNAIQWTFLLSGVLTSNVTIVGPYGPSLYNSNEWYLVDLTTGPYTITVCSAGSPSGSQACSGGTVTLPHGYGFNGATSIFTDGNGLYSGVRQIGLPLSGGTLYGPLNGITLTGSGTTGTITGTALAATCDSGTASVTSAVVGHPVSVSSTTGADVGGAFSLRGSVTSAGTVTVYVCGTGTPASLAYNVTVF